MTAFERSIATTPTRRGYRSVCETEDRQQAPTRHALVFGASTSVPWRDDSGALDALGVAGKGPFPRDVARSGADLVEERRPVECRCANIAVSEDDTFL